MVTRKEAKEFKPTRSAGFALCEEINGTRCTCRINGRNPCSSLVPLLRDCFVYGVEDVAAAEKRRIRFNRHFLTNHRFPSNCIAAN